MIFACRQQQSGKWRSSIRAILPAQRMQSPADWARRCGGCRLLQPDEIIVIFVRADPIKEIGVADLYADCAITPGAMDRCAAVPMPTLLCILEVMSSQAIVRWIF